MAKYTVAKVSCIPVEEIHKYNKNLLIFSRKRDEAKKELRVYLRELCSKTAFTLPGMVAMVRAMPCPPISENLKSLIQSLTNRGLKRCIDQIIIQNHGNGAYTSFSMYDGWDRTKKSYFGRWYYYYDKPFVNVYRLTNDELPMYINHDWEDDHSKEVYTNRMHQLSLES